MFSSYLPSAAGLSDFFGSLSSGVKSVATFAGDLYGQYAQAQTQVNNAKLQQLMVNSQYSLAKQGILTDAAVKNAQTSAVMAQAKAQTAYLENNPSSPFLPFMNAPSFGSSNSYAWIMLGIAAVGLFLAIKK